MKKNMLMAVIILLVGLFATVALAGGPVKINRCKTISKSGSYVVTKNLKATAKRDGHCIIIDANFVTLDLNGFILAGLENNPGFGIWDNDTAYRGITIRNGTVTGFKQGIYLTTSVNSTFEITGAYNNSINGISGGIGSTIRDNQCANNEWNGIYAQRGSLVSGNTSHENVGVGLWITCPSNIINNISSANIANQYHYSSDSCNTSNNL